MVVIRREASSRSGIHFIHAARRNSNDFVSETITGNGAVLVAFLLSYSKLAHADLHHNLTQRQFRYLILNAEPPANRISHYSYRWQYHLPSDPLYCHNLMIRD